MTMTTDTNKLDTATTGQPHLAKQCLEGLDVNKLTPLSPEVGYYENIVRNVEYYLLKKHAWDETA